MQNSYKTTKFYRTRGYWPYLAFLLVTVVIFRKVIFGNFMSVTTTGDSYHCFYSWSYYFSWAAKKGLFAFWNFMNLCGQPFGIEPPSNFNILNFLAVIFSPKLAWSIRHILCIFLAASFTYLYARSLKVSRFSSFLAGLIYMFMDTVLNLHFHTVSFFIPLIFIALEKGVTLRKNSWFILAGMFTALYYFNANPQYALYIFIFAFCYIVFRFKSVNEKFELSTISRFLLIFIIFSFLFSSIQFFRMYDMAKDSQRQISFHTKTYFFLPPTHFITAIIPYFYESPFRADELNFFFGRFWLESIQKFPSLIGNPYLACLPYVGIFTFILGALAFIKRRPRSPEQFFGLFSVLTVVLMATSFLWHMFIRYVPFLNQMHQVQRLFIIYEFSLPILSAIGLDILLKSENRQWQGVIKRLSKALLLITSLIGTFFFIAHFFISNNKLLFLKTGKELINRYLNTHSNFIAPPELYDLRLTQLYEFLNSWTDIAGPSFCLSAIIIAFCIFALYLYRKGRLNKFFFPCAVVFLVLGDLFLIKAQFLELTPKENIAVKIDAAEFLKTQNGIFRVFRLQDKRDLLKPMDPGSFLRPNTNLFYGISSIEGWSSLMLGRSVKFMRIFEKDTQREMDGFIGEFQDFEPRLLNLMNVKYVVTSYDVDLDKNMKVAYEGKKYRVYENSKVLPRAFMVYKTKVVKEEKDILALLHDPAIDLEKEIILEEQGKIIPGQNSPNIFGNAKVEIKKYEPHRVNISAVTPEEGYLFLSDTYTADWKAYVDAKPAKLYRADYIFRAVKIPQGRHEIEFRYEPRAVKLGLITMCLALFAGGIFFIKDFIRK